MRVQRTVPGLWSRGLIGPQRKSNCGGERRAASEGRRGRGGDAAVRPVRRPAKLPDCLVDAWAAAVTMAEPGWQWG